MTFGSGVANRLRQRSRQRERSVTRLAHPRQPEGAAMGSAPRLRHGQLLVGVIIAALLAGCSGTPAPMSPAPASFPAPTPIPTPTPTPAPTAEDQLAAACEGEPVPWAAPYAGKVHPLVVVDTDWLYTVGTILDRRPLAEDIVQEWYAINGNWLKGAWTGPMIQLVVCDPGDTDVVKVDSCGKYTRKSDGVTGKLLRYKWTKKIRVVVAATGEILQTKVIAGKVDKCPGSYSSSYGTLSGKPPWELQKHEVTNEQINAYAVAVSKQPVR